MGGGRPDWDEIWRFRLWSRKEGRSHQGEPSTAMKETLEAVQARAQGPGSPQAGLPRALSSLGPEVCPAAWFLSLEFADLIKGITMGLFFFWPGVHYSKPEITKLEFLSAESCDFFQALSHFRVLKLCMIRWSLTIPALSSCEGEESSGLFMTSEKQFPRWLFHSISFPHKFFTGRTI